MENNDLSKQLSGILEDPEMMSRIMSIAGNLMSGPPTQDVPSDSGDSETSIKEPPLQSSLGSSQDPTGGIDLNAALPLLSGLIGNEKKNDPRANLLRALKPYMRSERRSRIDMLIKAISLADIAGGFIGGGSTSEKR